MQYEVGGVGYEIWKMKYKVWGMRYEVWCVGIGYESETRQFKA